MTCTCVCVFVRLCARPCRSTLQVGVILNEAIARQVVTMRDGLLVSRLDGIDAFTDGVAVGPVRRQSLKTKKYHEEREPWVLLMLEISVLEFRVRGAE